MRKFILTIITFSTLAAHAGEQNRINFNYFPLLAFGLIDVRITEKFTIGYFGGSLGYDYSVPFFGIIDSASVAYSGAVLSYWPNGALKNDYGIYLLGGSLNATRALSSGTSTSNATYGGLFIIRYWMWNNGFNLSLGLGAESIGVNSTTGANPLYRNTTTKITLPLGIGWAF
jgi:hypothetical protein